MNWASLVTQVVKICLQCRRPWFNSWVGKIHWRRDSLPTLAFLNFPNGSPGKESACSAGDLGLIPGLGRSPGEGNCYPLQYSGLENSMDCIDRGVAKIQTRLSHFHFNDLKKRSLLHYCKNQISYSFNILIRKSRKYIEEIIIPFLDNTELEQIINYIHEKLERQLTVSSL